jgi:hypothetical protein
MVYTVQSQTTNQNITFTQIVGQHTCPYCWNSMQDTCCNISVDDFNHDPFLTMDESINI